MSYTAEERETHISTDDTMEYWDIYTTQRTMCTKIRKLKGVVILSEEITENGTAISGRYLLPLNQVSFRNKRAIDENERKKRSDTAKKNFARKNT